MAVEVLHPRAKDLGPALGRTAQRFLTRLDLHGTELSILLVGDGAIRQLNRRWRDIDSATDVLSFPSGDWMRCPTFRVLPAPKCHTVRQSAPAPDEPGTVLGDVVISFDTAKRRAGKSKAVIVREINRYLAHGLLHLLGYDHQTPAEAREMAAMEEELLGDRGMI
ncbi:MAG TPA: rRNA maturation RNase YbeY [Myxococcaceae bacterium]|nr:rRNA maturation RNase YbeY [Myxococcaceae bacterium]